MLQPEEGGRNVVGPLCRIGLTGSISTAMAMSGSEMRGGDWGNRCTHVVGHRPSYSQSGRNQPQLHSKSFRNRDFPGTAPAVGSCIASARLDLNHAVSSSASLNTISRSVSMM